MPVIVKNVMKRLLILLTLFALPAAAQGPDLSVAGYLEGYGKDATGGAGQSTCTISSSACTNDAGTWDDIFTNCVANQGSNKIVQFSVSSACTTRRRYVRNNFTLDGCLNGQNGVTVNMNHSHAGERPGLYFQGSASGAQGNVIIRCIRFNSDSIDCHGGVSFDQVGIDGDGSQAYTDVLIDRCTFVKPHDGGIDITNAVENVTVQRSLFHGGSHMNLVRYGTRAKISWHHNVSTRGAERNPQVRGDMTKFDFVSNANYDHDVGFYPSLACETTAPYAIRVTRGTDGDPTMNIIASAFVESTADIELEDGADCAGACGTPQLTYIETPGDGSGSSNYCSPSGNCPASPKATPNTIDAGYEISVTSVDRMWEEMLPYIGSPNREGSDQAYIDAVAAALPQAGGGYGVGDLRRGHIGGIVLP